MTNGELAIALLCFANFLLLWSFRRKLNWLQDTGVHLIKVHRILMDRTDPRGEDEKPN
jgi:nitrogen fixation-related uncharacterized protein